MDVLTQLRGPWHFRASSQQIHTEPAEGRPHGAVVASIGHHAGFIERSQIGPLLAAAPELLAALENLLSATEEVGYVHYAPLRKAARDAISKAKGGAS
jgi:hypothetical protein